MPKKAVLILLLIAGGLFLAPKPGAESQKQKNAVSASGREVPIVRRPAAFAVSQEIKQLTKSAPRELTSGNSKKPSLFREIGSPSAERGAATTIRQGQDGAIANRSNVAMPPISLSFDGLSNFDNISEYGAVIIPPDTIGDVGPGHYVQAVNALVRIFDKNGAAITRPFKMSDVFAPLGTPCAIRDDGDPIVLYDSLADRWILSQYCTNAPPFRQMMAVSKTGDPTGAYFLYEFVMPNVRLNDFPKIGVWPDGYYMSTEEFSGSDFAGLGVFAFDRTKMLAGDSTASYIYFNRPSNSPARRGNLLPADMDGLTPPAAGMPSIFVGFSATEYGDAADAVRLFDFHADFASPFDSSFVERPESPLAAAAFDPTSPDGRADIAQPSPGEMLDSNSDRLSYRVAYRNFGGSDSLVFNQTVRVSPSNPYRAGIRLYELKRSTGGVFSISEQATIGDPTSSRWIGSAAQDRQGNLAVGYNFVNDGKRPSINYTGRLAAEPAGSVRSEASLVNGTGVQKAFGFRWGDYSGMSVDPVDDCTFWMTGEYYTHESEEFSDFTWLTRIGRFKFDECVPQPLSRIKGSVTNAVTGQPIEGALVAASLYSRRSSNGGKYDDFAIPPGTYSLNVSAAGYRAQTVNVTISDGQTVTQNFALVPVAVPEPAGVSISAESCAGNNAVEPGESISLGVTLKNTGPIGTQNLTATLIPGNGVTNPGPPQVYGALLPNGGTAARTFSFTVSPDTVCGSKITLSIQLRDGTDVLGTTSIPLQTGSPKIALQENFDRTQFSRLPPRWTRTASAGITPWNISRTRSQSGIKAVFSPDPIQMGLNELYSPVFSISTASARLTFRNWYEFETTFLRNRLYDGSVLEIRLDGGDWHDIAAAGGEFESGGYDGLLDSCCQNPLAGHAGWSGRSGLGETPEFITTSVKLPPAAAGHRVQLRWRVGTDIGGFEEGQYIDDILVTDGFQCSCQ